MEWEYEIGCSLIGCENDFNISLYVYNNKCRESILIGFCGKLISKFAFSFKVVELKSFKNWVISFLRGEDKNKNKYYENYGNDEYKVYESLNNGGDNVDDIEKSIDDEKIMEKFKIMMEKVNRYIYSFILEYTLNGLLEVTNENRQLLKNEQQEEEDYGKMIITAVTKTKKIINCIRRNKKKKTIIK